MNANVLLVVPCPMEEGRTSAPYLPSASAVAIAEFTAVAADHLRRPLKFTIWDEHAQGQIPECEIRKYDLVLISYLTPSRLGAYRVADIASSHKIPVIAGGYDVTGLMMESRHAELHEHFGTLFFGHLTDAKWTEVLSDWSSGQLKPEYRVEIETPVEFVDMHWERLGEHASNCFFGAVTLSRGCARACGFCVAWVMAGGKHKVCCEHDLDRIEAQIRFWHCIGQNLIAITDDNFGGANDEDRAFYLEGVLPLLRRLHEELGVKYVTELDVSNLIGSNKRPGLARQMRQSGFFGVFIGVETLSGLVKKSKEIKKAIRLCHKLGLGVLCSVILDIDPEATRRTATQMIRRLLWWGADYIQASLKILIPASDDRKAALAEGGVLIDDEPEHQDGAYATSWHRESPEERRRWLKKCLALASSWPHRLKVFLWVLWKRPDVLPDILAGNRRVKESLRALKTVDLQRTHPQTQSAAE